MILFRHLFVLTAGLSGAVLLHSGARPAMAWMAQERSPVLSAAEAVRNPEAVHARLRAKNPSYQNQGAFALDPSLGLIGDFSGGGVTDLSPLQGIPFGAIDLRGQQVSDLAPLKGMPLKLLGLEETLVTDLRPLSGMKLEKLYLSNTSVSDLQPLAGMPLKELMLVGTPVGDVRPLRKAPLEGLWLSDSRVADISPLAGTPLVSLTLEGTGVSDLRPLATLSSLRRLHIGRTNVSDLTPLKHLTLTRLIFSPRKIRAGLDGIRAMRTITELGTTLDGRMPPATFWQLHDQGRLE